MFSYHPNKCNIGDEKMYARNWRKIPSNDVSVIAKVGLEYAISPCTWQNGERKGEKFRGANFVALDFDDGRMTLADAVKTFAQLAHVIGTSKSHGIAKGSNPPCDRFHVFLRLDQVIKSREHYEHTQRFYARKYRADLNAVDAARKFNPFRQIVSVASKYFFLAAPPPPYIPEKTYTKPIYQSTRLPPWVEEALEHGDPSQSRNTLCFKIAVRLKYCGYTELEAFEALMKSPIPISKDDKVRGEVMQCVRNGFAQK